MPKTKLVKIKIFLLLFIVGQLFISYVNLAYAATDTTQPAYTGVQDQITTYLCTPTNSENGLGNTPYIGNSTAAANNPASADLYNCINKIYRFAIAFGGAVGIGFIVVAGYVYMGAEGNQESVQKAKDIFISSITAMVILFAGYILLRAINPDLLQFHNVQPATVIAPSGGTNVTFGGGVPSQNGVCPADSPPLCSAQSSCPANACSNYASAIQAVASQVSINGADSRKLISAIMYHESRCQIGATSGAGACGLMQLLPATANTFKTQCGVGNSTITCAWLEDNSNAQASICMAAKYLQSLAQGGCGSEGVSSIAAGYDGGGGACAASTDCTGTASCTGQPMEKWECLYNDSSHTVCNTGYKETRNYIPDLVGCYNKQ